MLVCGVGLFIPLVIQLWTISIRDHDFYQQRATDQQLMDVSVSAHRGDILDANGDVLAMSATVYNLILAPKDLMNSVDQSDYTDEEGNEDEEAWRAAVQELRDEIIDGLMAIRPDLDRADLERRMAKENSQYEVLSPSWRRKRPRPSAPLLRRTKRAITSISPPAPSGTTPLERWPPRCWALSTLRAARTAWRPSTRKS